MLLVGCDSVEDDPEPPALDIDFPAQVEYRVHGALANISYWSENSEYTREFIVDPWSYSFEADSLRPLYILAQTGSDSLLTVELWINNELHESKQIERDGDSAGILAWYQSLDPKLTFTFSGGWSAETMTLTAREPGGNHSFTKDDLDPPGFNVLTRSYDAESGFDTFLESTVVQGQTHRCYSTSISYDGYSLAGLSTCEDGYNIIRATLP